MIVEKAENYPWQKKDFDVFKPEYKVKNKISPYLTFALTKICNLRCIYCGQGGELTNSKKIEHKFNQLIDASKSAFELGIRKIRITGGEPFEYSQIYELLKHLESTGMYILVNTNGTIPIDRNFVKSLNENIHFAVHLDTLDECKFDAISTSNDFLFHNVLDNIKLLSRYGRLLRVNRVHLSLNKEEFFEMINFCSEISAGLKTFEISRVPAQFENKDKIFAPLRPYEEVLSEKAELEYTHEYSKGFGTPCQVYVLNGVHITIKSIENGSRFDRACYCRDCSYFPCDEGLYDILYYPDGTLCGCRWFRKNMITGSFTQQLRFLINVFRRSSWHINGKPVDY